MLQNLIANAIRYTDAGRVLVGARRSGDAGN
jgi:signal transduction histidine kinase